MFTRKKYRAMLAQKTEELTPNDNPGVSPSPVKKRSWIWALSISGSVAVAGVVALSCYAGGLFGTGLSGIEADRLIKPSLKKIVETPVCEMSETAYNSYLSFSQKFTKLAFQSSIASKGEISLGVSLPDAYLNLALCGFISSPEAENDILAFLNLNSESELMSAAKEIVASLCTLSKDEEGRYNGGYNLNSLWLNLLKVSLLPADKNVYEGLADIFDASVYKRALTSEAANAYLQSDGLSDMPTPKIQLDNDDDPSALSLMSVYYCMDSFFNHDDLEALYRGGNDKMEYQQNGATSEVHSVATLAKSAPLYEGKNFLGTIAPIQKLQMAYFLPSENDAMPSLILDDVLASAYQEKSYSTPFGLSTSYDVTTHAPYFKLNNSLTVYADSLAQEMPHIVRGGMGAKMVTSSFGSVALSNIMQQSVMSFDYNGFYSCSVTVTSAEVTSASSNERYTLNLNHPYLFAVQKPGIKVNDTYHPVPLVIGEIIDPAYGS
jgi:hypothetical protein